MNSLPDNEYMSEKLKQLKTALYIRLSREDGDKAESLSVSNQRLQLREFIDSHDDLCLYDIYIDGSDKIGLNQKDPYSRGC